MAIPSYAQLMLPILKLLKQYDRSLKVSEITELLGSSLGLSDEEMTLTAKGGYRIFADRVSWAKTYLTKAGLIDQPQRAYCQLSIKGRQLELHTLQKIDVQFLSQYPEFLNFYKGNNSTVAVIPPVQHDQSNLAIQTPDEIINEQIVILEAQVKDDLLKIIKNNSPAFFERLVVDLLVAMGYGGSHQDAAQAIGKTNDGGIDGIISEDRLGLDKIYIQAKRWENTVGRPDIQQFKGALADQVAKKGVFITTSSFSKEAIESAKKSGIVLIDGDRLTSLMIEFRLGITIERSFHVYRIDSDRFEEGI